MKPHFFIAALFISTLTSCTFLDLGTADYSIDPNELFGGDRLSYRYENEILNKGPKENRTKEKIESKRIVAANKRSIKNSKIENDSFNSFKKWRQENPESKNYEDYNIWLEYQGYLKQKSEVIQ
ncbi:MAG: hypothetical protein ACRBBR_10645 [Cellvibrionaceae bacterium]